MQNQFKHDTVMIVTQWHTPAGSVEVFVENLVLSLSRNHQVVVAVELVGRKLELPLLPGENVILRRFSNYRQLRKIIKDSSPDIVHIQQWTPLARQVSTDARFLKLPMLLTLHEIPHASEFDPTPANDSKQWRDLQATSRLIPIVAPSPYMNRLATEHSVTMYGRTISSGVDTNRYQPGSQSSARKELNLPMAVPLILFVGNYGSEKNLIRLLYAMQRLPRTIPAKLVTVGFPAAISKLGSEHLEQAMVDLRALNRLIDFGPVDHDDGRHPLLYQAADIFVMPSLFEPRGIATLEAMASGLPVVASRQGILEHLISEGRSGLFIDPTDVNGLRDSIATLILNKPARLAFGAAARERITQYDVTKTTNAYKILYGELINQQF